MQFFISYTQADEQWALWLYDQILEVGHRAIAQAIDFRVGDNFVVRIHKALKEADFVLAVLSPAYLDSRWCEEEWAEAVRQSVEGGRLQLLPVRVLECKPEGLLGGRIYLDLVGKGRSDGVEAVRALLHSVSRSEPARQPNRRPAAFPGPTPIVGVPRATRVFVGRDRDVATLRAILTEGGADATVSVEGLSGIGKTEVAIELCRQFAREGFFSGGIYWLDCNASNLVSQWAGRVADSMGLASSMSPADRAVACINRIASQSTRSLIVLDNVSGWRGTRKPTPLPDSPNISFLLTSQIRGIGGSEVLHFPLGALGRDESEMLVSKIAGSRVTSSPGFVDLIDYLAGHALSIELSAVYFNELPNMSPKEYLRSLQAGREVGKLDADQRRHEATTQGCFASIWRALEDRDAAMSWLVAARFASVPCRWSLSAEVGLSDESLRRLRKFHVVQDHGDGWTMHPLARTYGQGAGDAKARRVAIKRFVRGILRATKKWKTNGLRGYIESREHIERALAEQDCGDPKLATELEANSLRLRAAIDKVLHSASEKVAREAQTHRFVRIMAFDFEAQDNLERALSDLRIVEKQGGAQLDTLIAELVRLLRQPGEGVFPRGVWELQALGRSDVFVDLANDSSESDRVRLLCAHAACEMGEIDAVAEALYSLVESNEKITINQGALFGGDHVNALHLLEMYRCASQIIRLADSGSIERRGAALAALRRLGLVAEAEALIQKHDLRLSDTDADPTIPKEVRYPTAMPRLLPLSLERLRTPPKRTT